MLSLVVSMVVCLIVASIVVLYVAYPSRGERLPVVPWLGEAMGKVAESAPTIHEDELDLLRRR